MGTHQKAVPCQPEAARRRLERNQAPVSDREQQRLREARPPQEEDEGDLQDLAAGSCAETSGAGSSTRRPSSTSGSVVARPGRDVSRDGKAGFATASARSCSIGSIDSTPSLPGSKPLSCTGACRSCCWRRTASSSALLACIGRITMTLAQRPRRGMERLTFQLTRYQILYFLQKTLPIQGSKCWVENEDQIQEHSCHAWKARNRPKEVPRLCSFAGG